MALKNLLRKLLDRLLLKNEKRPRKESVSTVRPPQSAPYWLKESGHYKAFRNAGAVLAIISIMEYKEREVGVTYNECRRFFTFWIQENKFIKKYFDVCFDSMEQCQWIDTMAITIRNSWENM